MGANWTHFVEKCELIYPVPANTCGYGDGWEWEPSPQAFVMWIWQRVCLSLYS